eukprot:7752440-Ditylum_brightwellii.AAC.1
MAHMGDICIIRNTPQFKIQKFRIFGLLQRTFWWDLWRTVWGWGQLWAFMADRICKWMGRVF